MKAVKFEIGDKVYDPHHKKFGEIVGSKFGTTKYKIAWLVYDEFPTYDFEIVGDIHKLNRYQLVEQKQKSCYLK